MERRPDVVSAAVGASRRPGPAARFLIDLAGRSSMLPGLDGTVLVDVDDSIVEVHGYAKQGAGFGYSGVRGLNMLLATVSTTAAAPVIVAQRLRKGSCASPRGANRLVSDALATVRSLRPDQPTPPVLLRADSAFYGWPTIGAAARAGAQVSVTVRTDPKVKAAIATIATNAWTPIEYTDAVYDSESGQWISRSECGRREGLRDELHRAHTPGERKKDHPSSTFGDTPCA